MSAQSNNSGQSDLIDALSSKFHINKDEVKQVFEEQHEKREAAHEKRQSERLQKLVENGTITANQKSAIESKLAEMKADREANKDEMKDLTPEQRKAKHDEKKAEIESWAKDNNIDLSKIKGVFVGGPEGHRGHRPMNDQMENS